MSLRDDILSAACAARQPPSPQTAWGVHCFLRVMSGTERDAFEASLFPAGQKTMSKERFRAAWWLGRSAMTRVRRVFADGDIAALGEADCVELDRLFGLASRLNGLSPADVDDLTKTRRRGTRRTTTLYLRLARNVFGCSVSEMLARLDSAELAEWEAFDRLEPLDHGLRAELAAAIVAQTAANLHRGENAAPYVLDDFRIDWAAPCARRKRWTSSSGWPPPPRRSRPASPPWAWPGNNESLS